MDFNAVYNIDVSSNVEKKGRFNYLSWAHAWKWFVSQYPNAKYEIVKDENNKCYFGDKEIGYMVYTRMTVEELTHEMWLPIMDFNNKAMKNPSMMDVNKAVMRCLVKNMAMFGLGLNIYAGEDLPTEDDHDGKPNKTTVTTHKTMPKTYTQESIFDFGNNKGKTFGEVYKENPSYFEWLSKNAKDEALKEFSKKLYEFHLKNN